MAKKEYRINVYDNADYHNATVIARVRFNQNLDFWDGHNFTNGGPGMHKGITKLQDGRYVIIITSDWLKAKNISSHTLDWLGVKNYGYVVTKEEALQEILRSGNVELLETKKFKELKKLYEDSLVQEIEEEE